MGRGDLTDREWRLLEPLLPVSAGRGGRWADHRRVIDGVLFRDRTGLVWRDLPERFGPWSTVYERHRRWSADGTWERILAALQRRADARPTDPDGLETAIAAIAWGVAVDSTVVRAHQHAAGARKARPRRPAAVEAALDGEPPPDVVHVTHFSRTGLAYLDTPALSATPVVATLTDYTLVCPDHQLWQGRGWSRSRSRVGGRPAPWQGC